MAHVIRMPGISADSEEAVLLEWNIASGSAIRSGDNLATVETEKANVDIEADGDGTLWRTLVEPGTTVAVGAPIAVIVDSGENTDDEGAILGALGLGGSASSVPAAAAAAPSASAPAAPASVAAPAAAEPAPVPSTPPAPAESAPSASSGDRQFSSPLARKIARDAGVPLEAIVGTGPSGRIIRADVERAIAEGAGASAATPAVPDAASAASAAPAPVAPASAERYDEVPHTKLRRAIAGALQASKQDAPHFYLTRTARVDELLGLRARVNANRESRISINDFVVKAVAVALAEFPDVRVTWGADAVRRHHSVDVAVAIQTERGLVTPVVRDADRTSLGGISATVRDFAGRAADGKLKQHELEGGTFTVTNLGMFGVEEFSAIINPPHAGILAVGAVVKRPVVGENDVIEVGHTLTVTVSADHRPVDGVLVARWLQRFIELLENPLEILT